MARTTLSHSTPATVGECNAHHGLDPGLAAADPPPCSHSEEPGPSAAPPEITAALRDLACSKALTPFQANRLAERWADLPDDWATAPAFRDVREHTRAVIDRLNRSERVSSGSTGARSADQRCTFDRKD